jgi:hypothetical protein
MNKTIVASVGIITAGVFGICVSVGYFIYLHGAATETRDRLTVCIQMVMSESRASDKLVDAEKAREICS